MHFLGVAPLVFAVAVLSVAAQDDGIGTLTITVKGNVLTIKLCVPQNKFNLVSFHLRLDHGVTVPEQGTIASPDLHPPKDYKNGCFVWSVAVAGKKEADLKGKPCYYWVRVEQNGLGMNGNARQTTIG